MDMRVHHSPGPWRSRGASWAFSPAGRPARDRGRRLCRVAPERAEPAHSVRSRGQRARSPMRSMGDLFAGDPVTGRSELLLTRRHLRLRPRVLLARWHAHPFTSAGGPGRRRGGPLMVMGRDGMGAPPSRGPTPLRAWRGGTGHRPGMPVIAGHEVERHSRLPCCSTRTASRRLGPWRRASRSCIPRSVHPTAPRSCSVARRRGCQPVCHERRRHEHPRLTEPARRNTAQHELPNPDTRRTGHRSPTTSGTEEPCGCTS